MDKAITIILPNSGHLYVGGFHTTARLWVAMASGGSSFATSWRESSLPHIYHCLFTPMRNYTYDISIYFRGCPLTATTASFITKKKHEHFRNSFVRISILTYSST